MRLNTTQEASGNTVTRAWPVAAAGRAIALLGARAWTSPLLPAALFLLAATALLLRIDQQPPFNYNWEEYTAWRFFPLWDHPDLSIFLRTEGLMTDSGTSPLIALPVWVGFWLFGPGLAGLRVPVALIAASAVPLLWLVGKRLVGPLPATLAAALLALSPVFLLYGRTATTVGISLAPALLSIYALMRVLHRPRDWHWLVALQILLFLSSYAYAPIRFLWPMSVGLLLLQFIRRKDGGPLLVALLATALTLPAALWITTPDPLAASPFEVAIGYFHGRGEQVTGLLGNTDTLRSFVQADDKSANLDNADTLKLLLILVRKNAIDFANLLLDHNTTPTIIDYWREQGRLYSVLLVPFFLIGLALTAWRVLRRESNLVLLTLFLGFGLPILLTTQVHVGRLIYMLPLLLLIVARGFVAPLRWLTAHIARWRIRRPYATDQRNAFAALLTGALCLILVALVGLSTWNDYSITVPPTNGSLVAGRLLHDEAENTRPNAAAVLVTGGAHEFEIESIHVAGLRLELPGYRFVNLRDPDDNPPADGRPTILYGGLLDMLGANSTIPHVCQNTYYVTKAAAADFATASRALLPQCGRMLRFILIPG